MCRLENFPRSISVHICTKKVMIILFVELCLAHIFRLMVTLVLISIHGINTSVILIHSVSVVKFTLVRFYHINEIRQGFFFHDWDGFKVSHHALKKCNNLIYFITLHSITFKIEAKKFLHKKMTYVC